MRDCFECSRIRMAGITGRCDGCTISGLRAALAAEKARVDELEERCDLHEAAAIRERRDKEEARHLCGEWRHWARRMRDGATDWMAGEEETFPWGEEGLRGLPGGIAAR